MVSQRLPTLDTPEVPQVPLVSCLPGRAGIRKTSPRRDTAALSLLQLAEVRGRPAWTGDHLQGCGLSLAPSTHPHLSMVLACPGGRGADNLGAPSLLSTLLTCWPDPGPRWARSHSLVRQQVAAGAQLQTRAPGWPPAPSLPNPAPLPQLSSLNC